MRKTKVPLLLISASDQDTQQDTIAGLCHFLLCYSFLLNDATNTKKFCDPKTSQFPTPQGNIYMGTRYLDPKYSRWISVDPALGEYMSGSDAGCGGAYNPVNMSLYHYAGNNPIKYTDPYGLYDTLSEDGKQFIKELEGFRGTIYDAKDLNHKYKKGDSKSTGDWTIGYGHQLTENELLTGIYDDGITEEEASALFDIDSQGMVEAVNKSLMYPDKLSQNQLDALVSFTYSVGKKGFEESKIKKMMDSYGYVISITEVINSGGFKQRVSDSFRWHHPPASNTLHAGIKKRRYNEIQMFLYSDYTIDDIPSYIIPRWPVGTIIKKGEK